MVRPSQFVDLGELVHRAVIAVFGETDAGLFWTVDYMGGTVGEEISVSRRRQLVLVCVVVEYF